MKSDGAGTSWSGNAGMGCTPPASRVPLLPKNMNVPFIKRFLEWWK